MMTNSRKQNHCLQAPGKQASDPASVGFPLPTSGQRQGNSRRSQRRGWRTRRRRSTAAQDSTSLGGPIDLLSLSAAGLYDQLIKSATVQLHVFPVKPCLLPPKNIRVNSHKHNNSPKRILLKFHLRFYPDWYQSTFLSHLFTDVILWQRLDTVLRLMLSTLY